MKTVPCRVASSRDETNFCAADADCTSSSLLRENGDAAAERVGVAQRAAVAAAAKRVYVLDEVAPDVALGVTGARVRLVGRAGRPVPAGDVKEREFDDRHVVVAGL